MRTMLVAIDGSDVSLRALEHAARLASVAQDWCLHILCVQPPPRVYGEIEVYNGDAGACFVVRLPLRPPQLGMR